MHTHLPEQVREKGIMQDAHRPSTKRVTPTYQFLGIVTQLEVT